MYCRHCTRRRFAGQNDCEVPMQQIDKCIDYVAAHPEVRDVLLSGGDSLMVSDEILEYIIKRVRAIPHVEIVRLGSRTPVVCPQRITPELCAMLKKTGVAVSLISRKKASASPILPRYALY